MASAVGLDDLVHLRRRCRAEPSPSALTRAQFSSYSFSLYSSTILEVILGKSAPLWKSFGWNTVINLFYIPGSIAGAFLSDRIGPRNALAYGVIAQALVGFLMAGLYAQLATPANIGGFVVIYGFVAAAALYALVLMSGRIFLSLGELGPGDNVGLVASKTSATAIRGQYYGIAAACGKIGAFVGSYVFPIIQAAAPNPTASGQYPFWVASSMCVVSGLLALFLLPHIGQDTITEEDTNFRNYLEANGFDISQLGIKPPQEGKRSSVVENQPIFDKPVMG